MEEKEDMIMNYLIFGFLMLVIGWLLYEHTGEKKGQIQPVYWAGVVTPLLSQITKKTFNLTKKLLNGK